MCCFGRMEHIPKKTHYVRVRTSNSFAIAYVVLSQKLWRALVCMDRMTDSHRRVDMGVTVGNCRVNHLLFADELVLHAWSFSTGLSAHI